jgi:iron complex outermembrane recepter protein
MLHVCAALDPTPIFTPCIWHIEQSRQPQPQINCYTQASRAQRHDASLKGEDILPKTSIRTAISGLAIAVSTIGSTTAFAQQTPPQSEQNDSGEIVVTAQRREQKLNDIPISIVAATGEALADKGIKSAEDLAKIVPGLTSAQTPYGTPVLTLRGVGFFESSLAATSPVAAYIDEAPIPNTRMALGTALDIQRVEVLKGPQGTLYGQNSTGGAINFIANKPTDDFRAGISASLGHRCP